MTASYEEEVAYYKAKYSRMSLAEVLADYMERTTPMSVKITHSYRIWEMRSGRVHLHLLDENGHTFAVLDLTCNEWSQLARCKAPTRGPMTYAMDSAVSARTG